MLHQRLAVLAVLVNVAITAHAAVLWRAGACCIRAWREAGRRIMLPSHAAGTLCLPLLLPRTPLWTAWDA
jgi:hypothetical protein